MERDRFTWTEAKALIRVYRAAIGHEALTRIGNRESAAIWRRLLDCCHRHAESLGLYRAAHYIEGEARGAYALTNALRRAWREHRTSRPAPF